MRAEVIGAGIMGTGIAQVCAEPQTLHEESIRRGHTGARGGRGFYEYPSGAHEALVRQRDARLIALRRLLAEGGPSAWTD